MNLLVTGAFAWNEDELNRLKQLGHEVVFMQYENGKLPCEAEWVEGIIGNGIFLSHSIEQFVSLRYIQLTSAGFDRVPMDYVKEHNISIFNARGVYSVPMAEFAVCGVLELFKHSRFFLENQKNHCWIKHRELIELYGKKVCIVGCGSVGTECAKRFAAFGCNVVGVDMFPYQSEHYEQMNDLSALDEALKISDVVVLTLPLTEQTHHMINAERLQKMKPDSVLVNIARGAVVDTMALTHALKTQMISGAVLDVFEEEPLGKNDILWSFDNVIITPHNSFIGNGNHSRLFNLIIKNLTKSEDIE